MYYVGILDGKGKTWGVRIPDLPGCHGAGATPEAATADAISAAREWVAHQISAGVPVMAPRALAQILPEVEHTAGEAAVMVPVIVEKARAVKANISMDAGVLEAIDEAAELRGLTRSAFLTSAALEKISGG